MAANQKKEESDMASDRYTPAQNEELKKFQNEHQDKVIADIVVLKDDNKCVKVQRMIGKWAVFDRQGNLKTGDTERFIVKTYKENRDGMSISESLRRVDISVALMRKLLPMLQEAAKAPSLPYDQVKAK